MFQPAMEIPSSDQAISSQRETSVSQSRALRSSTVAATASPEPQKALANQCCSTPT